MSELQVVSLSPTRSAGARWTEHGARIRPLSLLHASILLGMVANLGRIPVFDLGARQAPLLVSDLAVGLTVLGGLLTAVATRSLRLDSVGLTAILFASIGALSALAAGPRFGLSGFEIAAGLAYLARWCLYFGLYVVVVNFVAERHVSGVWTTLESAVLLFAAFGIVQSIFLPNFALMVYPDQANAWDAQRHRLVSTVLDPNMAAGLILTVLLVHLAMIASGAKVQLWKPVLLAAALLMTLSRSGILGLMVGVTVILLARGLSKRLMRFGLLAVAGMLAFLPKLLAFAADYDRLSMSDGSAMARVVVWQRALVTLWENPWIGVGFNTYGFVQEHRGLERLNSASYSAEGGLLFIAVMTGVVGLVVFIGMLWLVWRRCRAGWRDPFGTPEQRGLCIGVAAVTVAVCVHSIFVNSLLVPSIMGPLWVLWGLVFLTRRTMREAAARVT